MENDKGTMDTNGIINPDKKYREGNMDKLYKTRITNLSKTSYHKHPKLQKKQKQ